MAANKTPQQYIENYSYVETFGATAITNLALTIQIFKNM